MENTAWYRLLKVIYIFLYSVTTIGIIFNEVIFYANDQTSIHTGLSSTYWDLSLRWRDVLIYLLPFVDFNKFSEKLGKYAIHKALSMHSHFAVLKEILKDENCLLLKCPSSYQSPCSQCLKH